VLGLEFNLTESNKLLQIINIQTEISKLGLDLYGVMQLVVDRTLGLVDADGAAIELAEGSDMVYRATSGSAKSFLGLRLDIQHSISGLCVKTGKILESHDTHYDERVNQEACRKIGLRSMIVVPLIHKGLTVGVLKAMSSIPNQFKSSDLELLQLLSELVAASMFYATKYDTDDLFHKATHDSMTNLANHSLFMDRLRNVFAQSLRSGNTAGVLIIDMDGLKIINDTFGHRIGDAVIKEFSRRLKIGARSTDTVARLGGDEFGIILVPLDPQHGVETAEKRINHEIEKPFVFEDTTYKLAASIGGVKIPDDSKDIEQLLEIADKRMYQIKEMHHKNSRVN